MPRQQLSKTVEFVRFPGSNHAFPDTTHLRMREESPSRLAGHFGVWRAA